AFGLYVGDLLRDDVLVAGKIGPGAEYTDRSREARALFHVRELEGVERARVMDVVDDEIGFGDTVTELDDFNIAIGGAADALVAISAEDERLAVFDLDDMLTARVFFSDAGPRAIIEDVAVLQNFYEGGAFVRRRMLQCVLQVGLEDVDGAGNESCLSTDCK